MSSKLVTTWGTVGALASAGSLLSCSSSTTTHRQNALQSALQSPSVASTTSGAVDPANFVATVDNPYYPLPVGRVMVYRGTREGVAQTDTVTVTSDTKVIEGVHVVVVRDVATDNHQRTLEATMDWFAQDTQGNVWYFGEDTKAYDPDGTVDTSGSWTAGVDGATPGLIMEAHPKVPDAYRQEYLKGQAEDTAWIVATGGSATVGYGTVHDTVRSLEVTVLEPDVVDEKIYAPGLGIVSERSLTGPTEVATLISVTG
jgi:hypothetical protein